MPREPEFLDRLSSAQRDELESWVRERNRSLDDCIAWLVSEVGISVPKTNVWRWKRKVDEQIAAERASGAGSLAKAFMEAARESGGLAVPDAAVLMVAQMIFEQASTADRETLTTKDTANMALGLQRLMLGKQRIEQIKLDHEEEKRRAATEVQKAAKAGASGQEIADKLNELLGVTQ